MQVDDHDEPRPEPKEETKFSWRWLFITIGIFILVAGVIVGLRYFKHQASPPPADTSSAKVKTQLSDYQRDVNYPLYYPATTPEGFNLVPDATHQANNLIQFNYAYNGGTVIITEQKQPLVTEELKHTKDFKTPIAKSAFIADLEGHTAGFIRTGKTLVIFNPTGNIDGDKLQQLMQSLQPL